MFGQFRECCPSQFSFRCCTAVEGIVDKLFKPAQPLPDIGLWLVSRGLPSGKFSHQFSRTAQRQFRMNYALLNQLLQRPPVQPRQAIKDVPALGQIQRRRRIQPSHSLTNRRQPVGGAFGERYFLLRIPQPRPLAIVPLQSGFGRAHHPGEIERAACAARPHLLDFSNPVRDRSNGAGSDVLCARTSRFAVGGIGEENRNQAWLSSPLVNEAAITSLCNRPR